MNPDLATLIVFILLALLIVGGVPIFLALGFSSLAGMYMVRGVHGFFQLPSAMLNQLDNFLLVALPLYIFMGEVINRSGIGSEIYDLLEKWLHRIPGGLAIASIFSCAIFGAMCGVSIAGVAAIGVIAVPEMLKRGYDRSLAAGAVTSAGALAVLIPPSISFIIYGAIAGVSVGQLFMAGILPGIFLTLMMGLYVLVRVLKNPELAPRPENRYPLREMIRPLRYLWPILLLIFSVLGSIYAGIATPTEAGAVGATGALAITIIRGRINRENFFLIMNHTTRIAGMLLIILAAAFAFGQFLNLVRLPVKLSAWVLSLDLSPRIVILVIMGLFVVLGMFIDGVSLIIVTTPVVMPTIRALEMDPLWYGVLLVLNLEIACITPPVGLNLYAMRSAVETLSLGDILRGVFPYVLVEAAVLLIFVYWPELALWLPETMQQYG